MIYLDSAATALHRPEQVIHAVTWALGHMGNDSRGVHGASLESGRVIFKTRELLAELFGTPGPEQVAFTSNATESLNTAILGLLRPGDRVVTTVLEHNSVLRPLYRMEREGVELEIVGCEAEPGRGDAPFRRGRLDYGALERAIRPGTRAVICTHASNLTGNLTDIRRVGAMCRRAGAVFILDASQTAGVFPIHMERDFIDILCFTGHKGLMGPQGTGGICLGKEIRLKPLKTGGSGSLTFSEEHPDRMPAALEAGTLNGHGIAGLCAALEYLKIRGMDTLRRREQALAGAFLSEIRGIPGLRLYGDYEAPERAPMVTLNLGGEDSAAVGDWLARTGICVRTGGHCAPLMHRALGTEKQGAVRFSFSAFNTEAEVRVAAGALRELAHNGGQAF